MFDFLSRPWPWYVAGPLIGLVVPALLLAGNRLFGVSSNFRHLCAAVGPRGPEFFRYDWKGACPGPFFALLGSAGVFFVILLSAIAGTYVYGVMRPRLPH